MFIKQNKNKLLYCMLITKM